MLSAPPSDCEDVSVSSLSLSRPHVALDAVSSDVSLTNDTSSYIGGVVSRYEPDLYCMALYSTASVLHRMCEVKLR